MGVLEQSVCTSVRPATIVLQSVTEPSKRKYKPHPHPRLRRRPLVDHRRSQYLLVALLQLRRREHQCLQQFVVRFLD